MRAGHHVRDLNWRELHVLATHTRPKDALYQVVHGKKADWSQETHAIVTLAETVDRMIWTLQAVHTPPGKALPPVPKPRPRPGIDPNDEEKVSGDPLDKSEWAEFWRTGVHPNGRKSEPAEDDPAA